MRTVKVFEEADPDAFRDTYQRQRDNLLRGNMQLDWLCNTRSTGVFQSAALTGLADDEILLLCGQRHLAAPEHTAAPHDQKQIIIRAGIKFPDGALLKNITLGCIIHQKVLHETVMCNRLLYTTEKYNCYNCIIHQFSIVFNHFLDMY